MPMIIAPARGSNVQQWTCENVGGGVIIAPARGSNIVDVIGIGAGVVE